VGFDIIVIVIVMPVAINGYGICKHVNNSNKCLIKLFSSTMVR